MNLIKILEIWIVKFSLTFASSVIVFLICRLNSLDVFHWASQVGNWIVMIDWFWLILIDWYFLRKRKLISLFVLVKAIMCFMFKVYLCCVVSYTYIVIDCAHLTWRKEKHFMMQYLFLALVNRFNVLCTWSSETDQVFDSVSDQF